MIDFDNIIESTLGANLVQGVHSSLNNHQSINQIDDSEDIMKNTANIKASEYQQAGHDAGKAISIVQAILESVEKINTPLARLEELLKELLGVENYDESDETSQEVENLIVKFNSLKNETQINGNTFFSGQNEDISISMLFGATIKIEAPKLGLNFEQYDMTSKEGAEALFKEVQDVIEKSGKYQKKIESQLEQLGYAEDMIENKLENEMGVDMSDIDKEYASEVAKYAADTVIENMTGFFESQALIEPDIAAKLLDEKLS